MKGHLVKRIEPADWVVWYTDSTAKNGYEVKQLIVNFLEVKRINSIIFDYKVEDRTMFNDDNGLYFQIIYQPTRIPDFMVMDITLWNRELKISNFEKNVIGSRNIKKLEI